MVTTDEITRFRIQKMEEKLDKHEEVLEGVSEVLLELRTSHASMGAVNEKTNELLEKGFELMKRLLLMFAVTALGGAGAINLM